MAVEPRTFRWTSTHASQAIAAVGQCRLIALWDELFSHLRQPVAQILLTRNDIADVSHNERGTWM
jgi:glutamate 5-kinase